MFNKVVQSAGLFKKEVIKSKVVNQEVMMKIIRDTGKSFDLEYIISKK